MDNYHIPYGKGSSFSSWAVLSIPWIQSSSPDGDVGVDAFFCHRQSYFDFFLPKFQKIITLDILLHILLVIHLDLLPSLKILHEFDEGVVGWVIGLLQLFHGFLQVDTFDLWAFFIFRSETESLLLPIDVELDYSNSRINVCSCHAQEWPPQYERDPRVDFHVENDKINGDKEIPYFHQNILGYPRGMMNWLVC